MVNTLLFGGYETTRRAFDAYKQARAEAGLPRLARTGSSYMGFCYVGDSDEEALRSRRKDQPGSSVSA